MATSISWAVQRPQLMAGRRVRQLQRQQSEGVHQQEDQQHCLQQDVAKLLLGRHRRIKADSGKLFKVSR
jgi:hypothetical protein